MQLIPKYILENQVLHKEDIYHGTKGAILGGITTVFEMPNTSPATINKEQLDIKLEIANKKAFVIIVFS